MPAPEPAVKLYRCGHVWLKTPTHPCWRVQRALDAQGIAYEIVPGPWPSRKKRTVMIENTGQPLYPAICFDNGTWYREETRDMVRTIRAGRLFERR